MTSLRKSHLISIIIFIIFTTVITSNTLHTYMKQTVNKQAEWINCTDAIICADIFI